MCVGIVADVAAGMQNNNCVVAVAVAAVADIVVVVVVVVVVVGGVFKILLLLMLTIFAGNIFQFPPPACLLYTSTAKFRLVCCVGEGKIRGALLLLLELLLLLFRSCVAVMGVAVNSFAGNIAAPPLPTCLLPFS